MPSPSPRPPAAPVPEADADWVERYEVASNYDGWRLDQFLTHKLKRASRTRVVEIIRACVRLADGRAVRPAMRVRTGDVVEIPRTERSDPGGPPLSAIGLLASAPPIYVVQKPPGTLVHRTAHEATATVDVWLQATYPTKRIEPVHRLDRETSGCLVCAEGLDAIRALRARFEESLVRKVYLALVDDPDARLPVGHTQTIDTPLGFDPDSAVRIRMGAGDLPCATHLRVLHRVGPVAVLQIQIDRGRQHQIRAHLWMLGTPVVGDKLYGMGDAFFQRWLDAPGDPTLVAQLATRWHCLHAWEVAWDDGATTHRFIAPPPAHMAAYVSGLAPVA